MNLNMDNKNWLDWLVKVASKVTDVNMLNPLSSTTGRSWGRQGYSWLFWSSPAGPVWGSRYKVLVQRTKRLNVSSVCTAIRNTNPYMWSMYFMPAMMSQALYVFYTQLFVHVSLRSDLWCLCEILLYAGVISLLPDCNQISPMGVKKFDLTW